MQGIDNLNTERAGLLTQEEAKLCLSFGVCTTKCEFDAIHLFRERPECTDYQKSEDKLKLILPYAAKQAIQIRKKEKAAKAAGKRRDDLMKAAKADGKKS